MADETQDAPEPSHPLADKIRRAIKAHPVLRDQKKLEVNVRGRRVHVDGTVFTIDMYRQLVEMLVLIPGHEELVFSVEPEIKPPENRELEGRVPGVSQGPLPSDPFYSSPRMRPRTQ